MSLRSLILVLALSLALGANAAFGQALGGTYTCANGNPGGTFDYADIGDFFDDLEEYGITAPVVLDVYDDGGDFTSKASYQLGFDGDALNVVGRPVVGLSAANTLTIRAAQGESPVVESGGAAGDVTIVGQHVRGGMFFIEIGNISIEGLAFTGGDFGVHWWNPYGSGNLRIAGCRIYDLTGPTAVAVSGWGSNHVHDVVIENNKFWNCVGPTAIGVNGFGVVCTHLNGSGWIVRHNTVVHVSTTGWGWHAFFQSGEIWTDFSGNIVYIDHVDPMQVLNGPRPLSADHNVIYMAGQAKLTWGNFGWTDWQAAGLDPNGLNTDPLLVSVTPGLEDLRLRPDSPAVDLIPSGGPAFDVFGNPRPYGSGFDAGAHELQNFGARAGLPAVSALVGPSGGPFSITLNHGDVLADVAIQLSDPEAEDITVSSITASAALAGVAAPAIPAPSHPLTLAWTGFIDNTNPPGTYTWTIEFADAGTGFAMTCEVSITVTTPPPVALLTPDPLPTGRVAQDYSLALQATGTGTPVFSLLAGDLPPGLSLSATGHITGTPAADGEYTFHVQAADNFTTTQQTYTLKVKPKPPPNSDTNSCSAGQTNHMTWLIFLALAATAARSRTTASRKH